MEQHSQQQQQRNQHYENGQQSETQPGTLNCPTLCDWSSEAERRAFAAMCSGKKNSWLVPLGGNAFISQPEGLDESAVDNFISPCGIANWSSDQTVFSVYFHCTRAGQALLALRARVLDGTSSTILVTVGHASSMPPGKSRTRKNRSVTHGTPGSSQIMATELVISGSGWQLVPCGKFNLPMNGYLRMDLQGLSKSGAYFAEVTHLLFIPESDWFIEQTDVRFVAHPSDFYFGRRGPSVHLRYILPENQDLNYFYTELRVPEGEDVIGSYFCAAGFRGGYFGMQVNSSTERRILFSIWSEWNTDNPGDIPPEYRVELLKKGPGVITGEFGNEGAGGQSYLVFPWVAEQIIRFLVYATKLGQEDTVYTAWYNATGEPNDWNLIASFRKPKDSTYLTDLYAFSENFIPQQGHLERRCLYGNQWVYDVDGNWTEITNVEFTADATANAEQRMDISGGVDGDSGHFFLRNCGFFSDAQKANTYFQRAPLGIAPQIDFENLP